MNPNRADSTLRQASKIILNSDVVRIKNAVGREDADDLFSFQLNRSSSINIKLTGLQSNANLELYQLKDRLSTTLKRIGSINLSRLNRSAFNRYLTRLASSKRQGKQDEQISRSLTAGTYYLRVSSQGKGKTRYTLELSTQLLGASPPSLAGLPSSDAPFPPNGGSDPSPPTFDPQKPTPPAIPKWKRIWVQQFGTNADDQVNAIATGSDQAVYIGGATGGSLQGSNPETLDGFIRKYNTSGGLQWEQTIDSFQGDEVDDLAVDSLNQVYATGSTNVTAPSLSNLSTGSSNALLVQYDLDGDRFLDKQLDDGNLELGFGIALGADKVYVVGQTTSIDLANLSVKIDGFVAAFDQNGQLLNQKPLNLNQMGYALGVAVDPNGNVYITGITNGSLTSDVNTLISGDAFVAKYNASGQQLWFQTLASDEAEYSRHIAIDSTGAVYIAGYTSGSLPGNTNAGSKDGFLAKYDSAGNSLGVKQFGTTGNDTVEGLAIDSANNVYVAGSTNGSLFGGSRAGKSDAWAAQFDANGTLMTSVQVGTAADDQALAIAVDQTGAIYLGGLTKGNLGGANQDKSGQTADAWLAKYSIGS
jgi:hypothetical protein